MEDLPERVFKQPGVKDFVQPFSEHGVGGEHNFLDKE